MGHLRLALLGTPHIRHAEAPLTFSTRKALALLVYLAVEGGLHSREKLAALFWPDSDQQHGRAMLRYTLASLRAALGDPASPSHLIVERATLGFDATSPVELDLHTLHATHALARSSSAAADASGEARRVIAELEQAAALCRGEFLEGFSLGDAPDFDEWATIQREAWHRRMERVFARLSQLQVDRGELAEAGETIRRWLAVSPLNEKAHRRLMRLYLTAGDRTAALRAYDACRALLNKELHVSPAPETDALADRIRLAGPSAPRVSREPAAPPTPFVLLEGPLVGRSDEFLKLVQLYHAARQGSAQVVALQGEPGIGKTRLAWEFLGWAAGQGADVLGGRAFETGGRLPFQPLVDALRPRLEQENAPEDLLSDVWLTELGRLLPELRDRYPDLPVPAGDEAAARTRLFEAIARLGQALAQRAPMVLFVDDLQWADAGSLDILHYAGRRWAEGRAPLLLLLSLRPEALAATPVLDEWLVGLRRDLAVTEIDLGPLTFEDILHFVQGVGTGAQRPGENQPPPPGLEEFARWLFAETSGQPFFVVEILRALLERGALVPRPHEDGGWAIDFQTGRAGPAYFGSVLPPGVREVIRARLACLTHPARELLVAGAVLGQAFTFDQLCRVAGLSEDEALPVTDDVLRAHLLRETEADHTRSIGACYFFTHDKIRDVVYAEAGDARRRVFHRRALEALRATAPAAQLARHALAAGLEEPAVQFSLAAGDEAKRLLAAGDALAHYDRALEIAARLGWSKVLTDLHARRGKAFASLALWPEARRELEAALAGLAADQQERRAEILVDLLAVCWWMLDVPSLRRWAQEAHALAESLGRGDLETAAIGWLAAAVGADGDVTGCVAQCQRAFARSRELGVPPPAEVHTYISLSYYWLGQLEEAIERSAESVRTAREVNHTSATMFSLPHLGLALAASGRYDEAMRVFEEARRFGREYGIGTLLARAIAMSAGFHLDVFDSAGNEALAEEARELARSLSFLPPAVSAGIDLLLNFARRQDVGRAEKLIEEVTASVEKAAGWHGWLWSLRLTEARAEIALARGDWEEALRWAGDAIEQSRARARVKYQVLGLGTRAQALVALGRTKEAIADLNAAKELARRVGDPALFLRIAAGLLAVDGDDALALEASTAVQQIVGALPDAGMRRCFEAADAVRIVARLTS